MQETNQPKPEHQLKITSELSPEELNRIDQLLISARRFHYSTFLMAGLSLAISSLDQPEEIKLPIAGLILPGIQASLAIYVIALVMAICSETLFSMSFPWLKKDPRRPPFAWIALASGLDVKRVTLWIISPVFFCALFTSFYLKGDYVGSGLLYGSFAVVLLPRTIRNYRALISEKEDSRGGKATFSIYLLYWYRLFRQSIVTGVFLLGAFAALPKWRSMLLPVVQIVLIFFGISYVIRMICSIPIVYREIDRLGKRFGFPTTSEHYK